MELVLPNLIQLKVVPWRAQLIGSELKFFIILFNLFVSTGKQLLVADHFCDAALACEGALG